MFVLSLDLHPQKTLSSHNSNVESPSKRVNWAQYFVDHIYENCSDHVNLVLWKMTNMKNHQQST